MFQFSHVVYSIKNRDERYIYRNMNNGFFCISPISPYTKSNKNNICHVIKSDFLPIRKLRKHSFTGSEIGLNIGEAFYVDISIPFIMMDGEEFS